MTQVKYRHNAFRNFIPGSYFLEKDGVYLLLSCVPEKKIPRRNNGGGDGNRLKLRKLTEAEEAVYEVMVN